MDNRTYIAIDLKSFYASVECVERGLDPLQTNLVVADESRTTKTICLAVSPSLKKHGISGRARLFEVVQKVKEVNVRRRRNAPNREFTGFSYDDKELTAHPELELEYIIAPPRMAHYIKHSAKIYDIYLKYVAPEDMHVYSIDEVFMDVTDYLDMYGLTPRELAMKIILDVLKQTGITATAGIGTNMYLCKIAMDIKAKRIPADENGVRIAELDEMTYRREMWDHRPLTDFWRVGRGYTRRLEEQGLYTMGDIARCSIGKPTDYYNEELLYKIFGINAELLIDHAWGYEPCTIGEIKKYKPENNSICSGHVLQEPYTYERARLAVREMADLMGLDLVDKRLVTNQIVLTVSYDIENLKDPNRREYTGEIKKDSYGRSVPKHAHGTINLDGYTSSSNELIQAVTELYERIMNPKLLVRKLYVTANRVICEDDIPAESDYEQLDFFTDYEERDRLRAEKEEELKRERKMQEAMLSIKKRFGKNAILKGMNLEEGATAIERNSQIGGHKA